MAFYNKNDTYLTVISQSNMGKMSIFTSISPDRRPLMGLLSKPSFLSRVQCFDLLLNIYFLHLYIIV